MSNSLLPQQKRCHSRNQHNVTCWHNTVMTFFIFTYLDNGLSNDLYNINGWNLDGNTKIFFKGNAFGNVMTTSSETNDWDAVIVTIFRLWCQRCCHVVSYDNLQCLSDDKDGIIATLLKCWNGDYTTPMVSEVWQDCCQLCPLEQYCTPTSVITGWQAITQATLLPHHTRVINQSGKEPCFHQKQ